MRRGLTVLLMLATATAAAAGLSYDGAKAKADADEASLACSLHQALLESQGRALEAAFSKCLPSIPQPPDKSPFTVVMELDATGKVVATWRHGETPLAGCVHRVLATQTLFAPPRAPFYTSIEMSFD